MFFAKIKGNCLYVHNILFYEITVILYSLYIIMSKYQKKIVIKPEI